MKMILTALTVLLSAATSSAEDRGGYCTLWAREMARIEAETGSIFGLTFENNVLTFQKQIDIDMATATARLVLVRAETHYKTCMLLVEYPYLALPKLPEASMDGWARSVARFSLGRQGTVPAGEGSEPNTWEEACADTWRTFDPADGTVVRPASKGGKQKCPLVMQAGEWVIPEGE